MRPWRRSIAVTALLAVSALPLLAQPAEPQPRPFARARLEPGERVTVGQPVTVVVEVLVPSFFTGAPRFPALDVDDALAIFEDRGVNFTERIDGETWAGQSRGYDVYPQRPGGFEIEAIPVRVRYRSESGGARTEVTVTPPPVRFEAALPPEAADLAYFISSTQLGIEQSFDRQPGTLKVGEAFVRTITVTVEDALSMVIPPLPADSIPGLAVYADPPEVRDEGGERGERIVGRRIERITYVAEEAGEYRLAPVALAWWDVGAQRLRRASVPALEIRVQPNPELVAEIPLPLEEIAGEPAAAESRPRVSLLDRLRRWAPPLAAAALLLYLLARLWRHFQPAVRQRLTDARLERRESEAVYFARFRRAARSGDPRATWNRWTAWLDREHRGPGCATIRAFVQGTGDPDLEREARALDALLFAGDGSGGLPWSSRALCQAVSRARRRRRLKSRSHPGPADSLNPGRS